MAYCTLKISLLLLLGRVFIFFRSLENQLLLMEFNPFYVLFAVEFIFIGCSMIKAAIDLQFRRSLRAKRMIQFMVAYFTLKIVYSYMDVFQIISFSLAPTVHHQPPPLHSLLNNSNDTDALAGELEHSLRTSSILELLDQAKGNNYEDFMKRCWLEFIF